MEGFDLLVLGHLPDAVVKSHADNNIGPLHATARCEGSVDLFESIILFHQRCHLSMSRRIFGCDLLESGAHQRAVLSHGRIDVCWKLILLALFAILSSIIDLSQDCCLLCTIAFEAEALVLLPLLR